MGLCPSTPLSAVSRECPVRQLRARCLNFRWQHFKEMNCLLNTWGDPPPLWTVNIPDNIIVLSAVINASQMAILSSCCVARLFPKAGAIFPISTKNIFNFQIKIYKDSKTGRKAWTQTANEQNCSWQSTAERRELIMQYQNHKSISDTLDIKKQYSSSCCVD